MECSQVIFSRHAVERLFQREIAPEAISDLLQSGEVIASYPEDKPYPSVLLLGFAQLQPVHAVVTRDPASGTCYLVTVYRPDPLLWGPDFKTRR
jgi:Domain of unknown function (DUF4258)